MAEINNTPLVSVIIPNYCHARYLDERIQSILNQTYQNFELIILDDKSPDEGASKAVIEKYRDNEHVSHIVYNDVNSGSTFKQWDKGFSLAKGGLIWIAESDDSCERILLEKLVAEFKKNDKLVLAFCNSIVIDEEGNKKDIIQKKDWQKDLRISGKDFIHDYLYKDNLIYNASSALFRKDIVLDIDRQYTQYKGSGDWLFWIEICEQGNVSMLKEPMNMFRKHFGNVTTQMMCNGIQQLENKKIFDYLIATKLISPKDALKHKRDNLYSYKFDIPFKSSEIKKRVIDAWNPTIADNIYINVLHLYRGARHLAKKVLKKR